MNVLIVDDNQSSTDLLCEVLSMQTHHVCCAYTARQALHVIADETFDAALIDLTLPDLPGTEVARQLRAQPHPPLLVAISGYAAHETNDGTPGLFDHHLQKPIDLSTLDLLLQKIVP